MKNTFKKGDFVKGTEKSDTLYTITNSSMKKAAEVINVDINYDTMLIKYDGFIYNVLNSEDYFKLDNPPQTVVIYQEGNQVIALNEITGKKGIAKCNPSDIFDFGTGAKLALERVFAEDSVVVKKEKYEIGDRVKIVDEWNKNTNENSDGLMDRYLGATLTIREVDNNCYFLLNNEWCWNFYCLEGVVRPKKPSYYNGKVVCTSSTNLFHRGKIYEIKDGLIQSDTGITFGPFENFEDFSESSYSKWIEIVE